MAPTAPAPASISASDSHPELLASLRRSLGDANVISEGDLSPWEVDWRKRYRGKALAVVRPGSAEEVAAVVKACVAAGVPLVPQGGNTGLVGGSVPDESGRQIVLSLSRMNKVRQVDPENLTMTVEAGCILQSVQETAAAAGFLFPLSLGAEGSCTIGGNLSTNAGGTQVLRFGNTRELCLGLEVVTADGQIWDGLSGLRKDNTGYDLRDLYIGAEGTLGVITAATLKVYPQPAAVMTAMAACETLEDAVQLLQLAQSRLASGLTGFEVMTEFSLSLVRKHFPHLTQPLPPSPWTVLLEQSDSENEAHARSLFEGLLETALERELITDAVVAESHAQSNALWHLRESITLAQAEEGLNIKHDVSIPVSRMADFVRAADAAVEKAAPGARLVNFGHLGDGNLHYNVNAPEGGDAAAFLRDYEPTINRVVYDAVQAHAGSISAEHGIGQLKLEELRERKSPVALQLMRTIKSALDPQNLLNPGRVI